MSRDNGNEREPRDEPRDEKEELTKGTQDTTFVVMILRPVDPAVDPRADPNLLAVLTGWCVIAAHGIGAALRHVEQINFDGIEIAAPQWTNVAGGGKTAKIADGKVIQLLPAPLYIVETPEPPEEPLVVPPYIM